MLKENENRVIESEGASLAPSPPNPLNEEVMRLHNIVIGILFFATAMLLTVLAAADSGMEGFLPFLVGLAVAALICGSLVAFFPTVRSVFRSPNDGREQPPIPTKAISAQSYVRRLVKAKGSISRERSRIAMQVAPQAEWDAYVDGRIKSVFQELNVRMARSLGAAVTQSLAEEREAIMAELAMRDARIAALEQEFGAAIIQLLIKERERMSAELCARDERIAALEERLARAQDTVAATPAERECGQIRMRASGL